MQMERGCFTGLGEPDLDRAVERSHLGLKTKNCRSQQHLNHPDCPYHGLFGRGAFVEPIRLGVRQIRGIADNTLMDRPTA